MNNPYPKNKTLPLSPNLRTGTEDDRTVIRIRFSRKGATSFVAHLDMMRIFERAMKRAGIDCEYSQGFNPRPVMAFALPLGVGVETIDDYVDITVKGRITPMEVVARLKTVMPEGIDIIGAVKAPEDKESMMAKIQAAQYLLLSPKMSGVQRAIRETPELLVTKLTKGEKKTIDVKPLILSVDPQDDHSVKLLVKAGSKENLRPDLLLESLVVIGYLTQAEALDTRIIRTGTFLRGPEGSLVRPI